MTTQQISRQVSVGYIVKQCLEYYTHRKPIDPLAIHHLLDQFKQEVLRLEKTCSRNEIIQMLVPLRLMVRQSPFLVRAQDWPRGYQGDFETINYILEGLNRAPENSFGRVIEEYFLDAPICKQHMNKIRYQSELMESVIQHKPNARIISIGCGASPDIRRGAAAIKKSQAQITLVDIDKAALDFSARQLQEVADHITFIHGNIYKIMRNLQEHYDLILIGGVFDYLNDKTIISILKSLRNNLAPGGKIYFSNIAKGNPFRVYMEYLSNWELTERSGHDLVDLVMAAGWSITSIQFQLDKTHLTHLVELHYGQQPNFTHQFNIPPG